MNFRIQFCTIVFKQCVLNCVTLFKRLEKKTEEFRTVEKVRDFNCFDLFLCVLHVNGADKLMGLSQAHRVFQIYCRRAQQLLCPTNTRQIVVIAFFPIEIRRK